MSLKTCSTCGETKQKSEFNKQAANRDGLQSRCKVCNKTAYSAWAAANQEKKRAYRELHREEAKEAQKKWALNNRDKKNLTSSRYRDKNKKLVLERTKKWRTDNPGKVKASSAIYRQANKEIRRVHYHNRRAMLQKNGGKLSPGLADKLFKLQRGKCACCHVNLDDGNHLDHVIPVALGGPNEDWNMQLLCPPCNLSKNAKHPVDFMQSRGFLL